MRAYSLMVICPEVGSRMSMKEEGIRRRDTARRRKRRTIWLYRPIPPIHTISPAILPHTLRAPVGSHLLPSCSPYLVIRPRRDVLRSPAQDRYAYRKYCHKSDNRLYLPYLFHTFPPLPHPSEISKASRYSVNLLLTTSHLVTKGTSDTHWNGEKTVAAQIIAANIGAIRKWQSVSRVIQSKTSSENGTAAHHLLPSLAQLMEV